jgi:4-amino-4-deoxy-L-arabinose transferase-like glycosyltransferase
VAVAAGAVATWTERLLRPGRVGGRDVVLDVLGLTALALLLMATGLGLRDPWPADEPRFALVARDMLRSGDWLFPRVGGDLYADKPPVFFWLMAASMALTGSLRLGFLLPSLLAGVGTTLLVYDLLRRARGREVALAGAFLLLLTFQFTWQARQAQIDGVLCFLTTLSLYGLLRHLVLGPAPGWYLAGWAAAGFGVITKGVGFLPLLVLVPHALLAWRGWPAPARAIRGLPLAGAATLLLAIGLWFVPMMVASSAGGELLGYRNEILFQQTVTRYAQAWHHREPPWYYFTHVLPALWLPLIALVPWLLPRWRRALRERDMLVAVLLAWVVLVLAFFTASAGKRGVYVLPAVPALVMAAAPWLPELLRARGPRWLAFSLAVVLAALSAVAAVWFAVDTAAAARIATHYSVHPVLPLAVGAVACGAGAWLFRARDGWLALAAALVLMLATIGYLVYPGIDAVRSGRAFVQSLERASVAIPELGLVAAKEQYLLQLSRPTTNFGHARWREGPAEARDAAAWLDERPGRALLVNRKARDACFPAHPDCVQRGDRARARLYVPPNASLNTGG